MKSHQNDGSVVGNVMTNVAPKNEVRTPAQIISSLQHNKPILIKKETGIPNVVKQEPTIVIQPGQGKYAKKIQIGLIVLICGFIFQVANKQLK